MIESRLKFIIKCIIKLLIEINCLFQLVKYSILLPQVIHILFQD